MHNVFVWHPDRDILENMMKRSASPNGYRAKKGDHFKVEQEIVRST